jgi:hypothetical protein
MLIEPFEARTVSPTGPKCHSKFGSSGQLQPSPRLRPPAKLLSFAPPDHIGRGTRAANPAMIAAADYSIACEAGRLRRSRCRNMKVGTITSMSTASIR